VKDLEDRTFWLATESEIKNAETTDIYFEYTSGVLKKKGITPRVVMEVYARKVPYTENWGVAAGIYEVAKLLEGLPVDVNAVDEGEIFLTNPNSVIYEPILQIEGKYTGFATYENPILGFLCSLSGIATKAARIRLAAGKRPVFSFGTRRVHPVLAPAVERASFIGGIDRVSNILGARLMGKTPVGTMPHSFIQCFDDQRKAWSAFDEIVAKEIPRIVLVDTLSDEKTESIMALETLGKTLYGIRIDTPSSRRGEWRKIVEEVRWELNIRGGKHVKIFISGGLDEEQLKEFRDLVDGFGVGTSVSAAPPLDFSAKIVELEEDGKKVYRAKRGDIGGRKQVYRNESKWDDIVTLAINKPPAGYGRLLTPLIRNGEIVRPFKSLDSIQKALLRKLQSIAEAQPKVHWL